MGFSIESFDGFSRWSPIKEDLLFNVLYDDKKINSVLLYYNDTTTTKLSSKKYVTRPIVLECSSTYVLALAVACAGLIMRRSTHILLEICELLYFVVENFHIIIKIHFN